VVDKKLMSEPESIPEDVIADVRKFRQQRDEQREARKKRKNQGAAAFSPKQMKKRIKLELDAMGEEKLTYYPCWVCLRMCKTKDSLLGHLEGSHHIVFERGEDGQIQISDDNEQGNSDEKGGQ
jgi:hypothetical protein